MQKILLVILAIILNMTSLLTQAESHPFWLYEDGGKTEVGVILCHGKGGDPDSWVVGPLRTGLNEEMRLHTISLQMPGGSKDLLAYRDDFPEAARRIASAINYLQKQKGVNKIFLIGHSLGSRMASSFLTTTPQPPLAGFIGVAMLNNGGPPFDCRDNLRGQSIPILDIYGTTGQAGDTRYAKERRSLISPTYTQQAIIGADHAFSNHEDELQLAVQNWLKEQLPGSNIDSSQKGHHQ